MNYLALSQRLIRESGTMNGSAVPSSVTGQTGRLLKAVEWIATAWNDIQTRYTDWLWMRGEFSGSLLTNTPRYTPASLNITRWADWITADNSLTIYDPTIGVGDEQALAVISWSDWRQLYGRGTQTSNRPIEYAISPAGELCFGPIPDRAYTVNGEYYKSPQDLTANTDIPEMPVRFHMLIVWEALLYLDEHDEASIAKAQRRRQDVEIALEASQRPEVTLGQGTGGGPLA